MDIFEFGMKMEKDGEAFYRKLAGECGDMGLASILNMLADAEVDHFNVLEEMSGKSDPAMAQTDLLSGVKNVFAGMREGNHEFDFKAPQVDLYKKAQDLEKQSEMFYREKAEAAEADAHKEIFNKIAVEEKQHYLVLDTIIDFVSRPESWLENAEWNNLREY